MAKAAGEASITYHFSRSLVCRKFKVLLVTSLLHCGRIPARTNLEMGLLSWWTAC